MKQKHELNKELFETCNTEGRSPIDLNKVKSLLREGADPNFLSRCSIFSSVSNNADFAFPLLHVIAGKENSVEVAEQLIQAGAELTKMDTYINNTPLLTAIALRDEKLSELLILKIAASENPEVKKTLSQKDAELCNPFYR